jgi:hypothetical protein
MLRAFGSIVSLESESTQFDANDAVIDTEPCGDLAKRGTLSPPQPATRREGSKGANGPRCRSRRATPRRASFTDVQARDCPDIPGTAAANPPAGVRRGDGSCDVDPSTWSVSTLALERPPHPMRRGSERSAPPTFAARRTARAPYDGRAGIEVFEAAPTPPCRRDGRRTPGGRVGGAGHHSKHTLDRRWRAALGESGGGRSAS